MQYIEYRTHSQTRSTHNMFPCYSIVCIVLIASYDITLKIDRRLTEQVHYSSLILVRSQCGKLVLRLAIAELFYASLHKSNIVGHVFSLVHSGS